jgi:hypothetical protein
VGNRFTLQQFSEIFQVRNPAGLPYVLIGGQAVNYWAERYLADEPELRKHLPFTSEDIDFRGDREDVQNIAGQLDLQPVFPHKVAITALAGAIPFRIGKLASNIEVVRQIPGVSASEVDALAVGAEWSGRQIRVLDPISLLFCKVNLALTVSQEKRQDVEHLKILIICARGFLREVLGEVERGRIPARGWLGAVNKLMKLAKSAHGRKVVQKFEVRWSEILPRAEIARCKNGKIVSFREKQLAHDEQSAVSG